MYETDNGLGPPAGPAYRLPAGRAAARPAPVRAAHRRRHRRSRQPRHHHRPRHRPAAGHLAGRPAPGTGLRPRPGPLRRNRSDPPAPEDRAAQTRPLRHLPRPAARRQAAEILHQPGRRTRPDRRELRRRLRPDRPRRRAYSPSSTTGSGTAASTLSRPGPRPTAPGSSPWPAATPRPRRSASSWTPPPPTSPCSPSPRTPTSARPTSARSSGPASSLPEGSYGRRNRQAIAARETRVAARLRAVEQAYRTAIERDTAYRPPEPTRTLRSPELQADREIEMEAEP